MYQAEPTPTGPTLKFSRGDRLRILLKNELCKTDDEHTSAGFAGNPPQVSINRNKQHGINHTNLHTHGLWVSPAGNSDNVLISVAPGEDFQFEYLIPEEGGIGWLDTWALSKGAQDLECAHAWANFFLQPWVGALMTKKYGYGNTTSKTEGLDYADRLTWLAPAEDFNKRNRIWNEVKAAVVD